MKRFLVLIAGACALISGASAQTLPREIDRGEFSFRVGAYMPAESSLRVPGDVWFAIGGDFNINWGLTRKMTTSISLDWYTYNGFRSNGILPLVITERWFMGGGNEENGMYILAGAGIGFIQFATGETTFVARAGLGYNFTERYFLEGHFTWFDEPGNADAPTGIAVFAGMRL